MDGAKGEDYFSWDFKIVMSTAEEVNKDIVNAIIKIGYDLVESGQDEAYFKKTD